MLNQIKATYFLKELFEFMQEGRKLKIVKYSKYLQKILKRRLIHYKAFSEREIIYGPEGKGKEYSSNGVLLFEGEYLDGQRNGNCKEYNNKGELIFEGEYLKGKKWNGKEKAYDNKGKLLVEKEYCKGIKK